MFILSALTRMSPRIHVNRSRCCMRATGSKSQVSEMAKDLDSMVEDFRTRPLNSGPYHYLSCDALLLTAGEFSRPVGEALREP